MVRRSQKDIDMTQGTIWKHLVQFAWPLLVGSLFQQLYNTVDSIVVGNFVGKEALAAVGSVTPIVNALIGFFLGFAAGAGVVISQSYGAKNEERVSKAVHTTLFVTGILSLIITFLGIVGTEPMLHMMQTPEDVFGEASEYLKIYFAGAVGLLFYNMGSGILRAVGDSRRPLYFLIFSACVNTVLDILFVAVFHWGIAGAAWATVIAQAASAILTIRVLLRSDGWYRLVWKQLRIDRPVLMDIFRIGLPSAIQTMITAFSNVFVQSYINAFGSDVMAGYSSYAKLDQFALLPMQSLALATSTFVGQNYGAGQMKRVKKGVSGAWKMSFWITLVLVVLMMVTAPGLVQLFNRETAVVDYGVLIIRVMSPFYLLCTVNQIYACALRGLGDSKAPMVIMLGSFVLFRQIYLFTVSHLWANNLVPIILGYPFGWVLCSSAIGIYYARKCKKLIPKEA